MKDSFKVLVVAIFATAAVAGISLAAGEVGDIGEAEEARAEKVATTEWHEVTGTVTSINREKGLLSLKPEKGLLGFFREEPETLRLHYPIETVRSLKTGDTITALIAYGTVEPPIRAYDAPEPGRSAELGRHSVTGTVSNLQSDEGIFSLQSSIGNLTLGLPSDEISHLKDGDKVTVHLAFIQEEATDEEPAAEQAPEPEPNLDAPERPMEQPPF